MKKLILALVLAISSVPAMAWYQGGYVRHYHGGYGVGLGVGIASGVIISNMYRPPVYVQPTYVMPPVYTPPAVVYQRPADPCVGLTDYNGQYNPSAAQSYCRGQQQLARQQQAAQDQEAFNRGVSGQ